MHVTSSLQKYGDCRPTARLLSFPGIFLFCLLPLLALLVAGATRARQELQSIAALLDNTCCPLAKDLKQSWGPQLNFMAALAARPGQEEQTAQRQTAQSQDEAKPAQTKWHSLFDGKTLEGWKISKFGGEGEAKVVDGIITIEAGVTLSGITCTQDVPKMDYEIEYEAKRTKGIDFFGGLTFPYGDTHCSFIAAGWGGSMTGLSTIDDMDASENATTTFQKFEQNQWYKFRVRVTKDAIQCWIDDKQVVDQKIGDEKVSIRPEVERSKPLGISAWQSSAALRNIRWRNLKAED